MLQWYLVRIRACMRTNSQFTLPAEQEEEEEEEKKGACVCVRARARMDGWGKS